MSTIFTLWMFGAMSSAFVAASKGRNVWFWALAGAYLPPFGVVGYFVVPALEP